jgi:hypothetical protein
MPATGEFRLRVKAAREYGVVHCEFRNRRDVSDSDDPRVVADAFVHSLGFRPLGKDWRALPRGNATDVLERILSQDLAYGGQTMTETAAKELSLEFTNFFPGDEPFYTNGVFPPREEYEDGGWAGSWDPITKATFDTGVIAIGSDLVGLLWIEDED